MDLVLRGEESPGVESKSTNDTADDLAERIQSVVSDAKKCLDAAQQRQKAYADRFRRDFTFTVGSEVLLSTKHINVKIKGTPKLLPRWVGPFKVTQRINPVAYKLDLPASLKIHPVFHASLLKAYVPGRVSPPPAPDVVDGEYEWEVEAVLAHKDVQVRRKKNRKHTPVFKCQYLVKWVGEDEAHNTWEPEEHCKNSPELVTEYWARHALGVASNKRKHGQPEVQTVAKRRR
jgi:glycosylphosphatidylinositol phospholipase D